MPPRIPPSNFHKRPEKDEKSGEGKKKVRGERKREKEEERVETSKERRDAEKKDQYNAHKFRAFLRASRSRINVGPNAGLNRIMRSESREWLIIRPSLSFGKRIGLLFSARN